MKPAIKDLLMSHIGCYVVKDNARQDKTVYTLKFIDTNGRCELMNAVGKTHFAGADRLTPLLKPLSDFNHSDFVEVMYNVFGTHKHFSLRFSYINNLWVAGMCEEDDDTQFSDFDRISEADEQDHENTITLDKSSFYISHGLDREERFFVNHAVQAAWQRELNRLHFDTDKAIEHGLAMNLSTYKFPVLQSSTN